MRRVIVAVVMGASVAAAPMAAQVRSALVEMLDTERAFAARAGVVGSKQAFLEYFADDAIDFDGDRVVAAKPEIAKQPDPPPGAALRWEPRLGAMSAAGDLGFLTGPVESINPARDNGRPRPALYASVWKRQADGQFRVVLDVGVPLQVPADFAPGFTDVGPVGRSTSQAGGPDAERSLRDADTTLTVEAHRGQAGAYAPWTGPATRLHRSGTPPPVGAAAIRAWLEFQPPYSSGATRGAVVAQSGDLGYTYGTYAWEGSAPQHGFYARVWTRDTGGNWHLILDVLQPQL